MNNEVINDEDKPIDWAGRYSDSVRHQFTTNFRSDTDVTINEFETVISKVNKIGGWEMVGQQGGYIFPTFVEGIYYFSAIHFTGIKKAKTASILYAPHPNTKRQIDLFLRNSQLFKERILNDHLWICDLLKTIFPFQD